MQMRNNKYVMLIMHETSFQQKKYLVLLNVTCNKTVNFQLNWSVLKNKAHCEFVGFLH